MGESLESSLPTIALAVSWAAILLTIWSGLEYLWAARRVLTGGTAA